jgi:hypothetical protein
MDRGLWAFLSIVSSRWRTVLQLGQPSTVINPHRHGFRLFWESKSRHAQVGRKPIAPATITLIWQMSLAKPLWGAARIHAELPILKPKSHFFQPHLNAFVRSWLAAFRRMALRSGKVSCFGAGAFSSILHEVTGLSHKRIGLGSAILVARFASVRLFGHRVGGAGGEHLGVEPGPLFLMAGGDSGDGLPLAPSR